MDAPSPTFDKSRLDELMGRLVSDCAAASTAPLVVIGDHLGLYKALAAHGPMTSFELAESTGTHERYVREWLSAQAAAGYVVYHAEAERFSMTPEQAMAFADDDSPAFLVGAFETQAAIWAGREKIESAFRSGRGVGWHEHDPILFCGCGRFFRTGYRTHLVHDWLPAISGLVDELERGISVADVGCGVGASTIIMAEAFPNSRFTGSDYHAGSIAKARIEAAAAGVAGRVRFEEAQAESFDGGPYELVTIFDALHDMGDPIGAARRIRQMMAPHGVLMVVEPLAGDRLADNLNPIGRMYYSASTMLCTPASLSQSPRMGLGAQAGEKRLRAVLEEAGFSSVRRAAETPFNMVLEVRI